MSRRRRRDLRLPGGSIVRVDRNLTSTQMARLVEEEERWLLRAHGEDQQRANPGPAPLPQRDRP
jgi:hypothetical protein